MFSFYYSVVFLRKQVFIVETFSTIQQLEGSNKTEVSPFPRRDLTNNSVNFSILSGCTDAGLYEITDFKAISSSQSLSSIFVSISKHFIDIQIKIVHQSYFHYYMYSNNNLPTVLLMGFLLFLFAPRSVLPSLLGGLFGAVLPLRQSHVLLQH